MRGCAALHLFLQLKNTTQGLNTTHLGQLSQLLRGCMVVEVRHQVADHGLERLHAIYSHHVASSHVMDELSWEDSATKKRGLVRRDAVLPSCTQHNKQASMPARHPPLQTQSGTWRSLQTWAARDA